MIAPDLVGFGRSDKPARIEDHSYARHVEWVRCLAFDRLDLRAVTLVGQDWGGLIGLRLAAENPDRFARLVAANTGLPTGDQPMPEVWWQFRRVVEQAPELDVARLVQAGCRAELAPAVRAAYDAPFPDGRYQAGPRAMPTSGADRTGRSGVRRQPRGVGGVDRCDHPAAGRVQRRRPDHRRDGPGAARRFRRRPGRDHPVIAGAGHFLQEDAGEELARQVLTFVRTA